MDGRAPRGGRYVEMLGWYAPAKTSGDTMSVNEDRVRYWLEQGAELSEKAGTIVKAAAPAVIKELSERKAKKMEKARVARRKKK